MIIVYSFHVILTLLLFANGRLAIQFANTRFSTTTSPIKKEEQKIMDLCNPKWAKHQTRMHIASHTFPLFDKSTH